jgi:hypothetical protein
MKLKKMPAPARILICVGLLMATLPTLLADYTAIPNFLRGMLAGIGLGLEITGLVQFRRMQNTGDCG